MAHATQFNRTNIQAVRCPYNKIIPAPETNATVRPNATDRKLIWPEVTKLGEPALPLLLPLALALEPEPELDPDPDPDPDPEPPVPLGAEVTVPVPWLPAWLIKVAQVPVGLVGEAVEADPLKSQAEAPLPAAACCS